MAEVLIAGEWVPVEESVQEVMQTLDTRGEELSATPMDTWILLTASEHWHWTGRSEQPSQVPAKTMKVAVLAIQGVREPVKE
jgi:hypothetical protein